jgi:hypothetical protein
MMVGLRRAIRPPSHPSRRRIAPMAWQWAIWSAMAGGDRYDLLDICWNCWKCGYLCHHLSPIPAAISSHQQPSASPQPVTHSWGIATTCGCIAGSLCSGSYLSAFHTYAHPWPSIAASKSSKAGGNDGGSGSDRLVQWRAGSHGLPWWKGLGTQVITKDGSLDECW